MKRLTRRVDGSVVFPSELVGVTITPDNEYMYALLQRLAAYEDTGLEPEEVADFDRLIKLYLEAGLDKQFVLACIEATKAGMTIDRLHELAQADKEGRCVVLPGGGYKDKDGENALKSAMNTCFYHNNPVTRFIADAVAEKLTREEAEAALRREQDEA